MWLAKLVRSQVHFVPGKLRVTELFWDVPLDYDRPTEATIRLFGRAVRRREPGVDLPRDEKVLPWFLYLQGGPGMPSPAPQDVGWVQMVLDRGYQILLLDQRGTGLSAPITAATLGLVGDAVKQAEYLKLFRADNIVRDCEAIRENITSEYPPEKKKWSVLGQSFGGFCAVTYLSKFPEGLREVFTTGGLPPLRKGPDPVLERTYEKVQERNEAYYSKFPEDVSRVNYILCYLNDNRVQLPAGVLTPSRFLSLGLSFGMRGGLDSIHDIVLRVQNELETFNLLTTPTLSILNNATTFDNNILYAVLHEAIYCQGEASNWCAERLIARFSQFQNKFDGSPVFFTGEMIYPHMFESSDELGQVKAAADIIAAYSEWPDLYDEAQLAKNEVPVFSATFVDDMYVHYALAAETAAKIKGCKQFITNVMYHNAIRTNADELVKQLFALRDDTID
ncbi:prolyl peptidase [Histoplasma capsulatum var. duboisii H88]|uniref:Prolyl peptidase n=2 Tax=Ajellomyces capsulatus TaxID=5037 RepID=F0UIQ3_AJEC8|nr:prolyl peptidase [Histoplasma capsulatum H143]EGC46452.1 prolyl peptidase [Histoplasma capsulatum var. duboisii H88]QSS57081.1 prolyl peptidase [Histoplasma capsulatum var. duboisii H88]